MKKTPPSPDSGASQADLFTKAERNRMVVMVVLLLGLSGSPLTCRAARSSSLGGVLRQAERDHSVVCTSSELVEVRLLCGGQVVAETDLVAHLPSLQVVFVVHWFPSLHLLSWKVYVQVPSGLHLP